ncbi:MAG: NfeD family protein [Tissierellia bacterium]|nr:NfeD family protein [Tissierellia bacterium]
MFSSIIVNQYIFMFVLILGILAIIVEVFIPSFGLVGITGLYLLFNALAAVYRIENPYTYIILSIIIALVLGVFLIKYLMSKNATKKLVLDTKLIGSTVDKKKIEEDLKLLNARGQVIKPLRPSGLARINGKNYDVVSNGEYIGVGESIVVDRLDGNIIYCRREN